MSEPVTDNTPCICATAVRDARPPSLDTPTVLQLQKVSRVFDAGGGIKDVSLSLQTGEILGICGASGCGKSTLLRLIADLEPPDAGHIERRHGPLGMVFQEPQLLPWLSALDNVRLVLGKQAAPQALAALTEVGLEAVARQYPAQLSGGMRQRVGIARALAGAPDLLLMDEPFANLDYFTGQQLLELVRRRVLERGIAAIFVSHDVREIARLCDRVLVMGAQPGRLVAELDNPLHATQREHRPGAQAHFENDILSAIADGG